MLFKSFIFSWAAAPRVLHSFPTRRSSDLGAGEQFVEFDFFDADLHCAFGRKRDRKSTRLNSSHVAISYAVFCLKKKTTREPRIRTPAPKASRHPSPRVRARARRA